MFFRTVSTRESVVISLGLGVGVGSLIDSLGLVDRMFCRICLMCPLAVASDLGRCLWNNCDDSPSHVVKFPLSTAAHHVDGTGDPAVQCRYITMSLFIVQS